MNSTLFSAPAWFWGIVTFAAVLTPLLIHLINLFRYRKVKWAAMEFLLKSYRKKQQRIRLNQFFLITNRIFLLLLAMLFFGQFTLSRSKKAEFQPGTEHVILIDNSYSMTESFVDRSRGKNEDGKQTTCLDNARITILEMAKKLASQPGQSIRLLVTSAAYDKQVDNVYECDSTIESRIEKFFNEECLVDHADSPLTWLTQNESQLSGSRPIYLFSDMRVKDFGRTREAEWLSLKSEKLERLEVIQCSSAASTDSNLSIQSLVPENGFIAASVPFYIQIAVQNHSASVCRNQEVRIRVARVDSSEGNNGSFNWSAGEEPTVFIPTIEANSVAQVQVPLLVHRPGKILIEAILPDDNLNVDNVAHRIIDVKVSNQALLIAEPGCSSLKYLQWILEPRAQGSELVQSGFQTTVARPAQAAETDYRLDDYQVIFMLNDDLSDAFLIQKLEEYVRSGGLVVWVPGRFADVVSVNRMLYKNGNGLLPFPIEGIADLPDRSPDTNQDLEFLEPKIAKYFEGESAKLLPLIYFYKKFVPPRDFDPTQSSTTVIATVRGRATTPLILSSKYGKGTVISLLSPFDEEWNNWAQNPTLLVLVYQLVYQNLDFDLSKDLQVGSQLKNDPDRGRVNWIDQLEGKVVEDVGPGQAETFFLKRKGIYQGDGIDQAPLIVSLNTSESHLDLANYDSLPIGKDTIHWRDFSFSQPPLDNRLMLIVLVIIVLLFMSEQWLAYTLGFHNRKQAMTATADAGGQHDR